LSGGAITCHDRFMRNRKVIAVGVALSIWAVVTPYM